MKDPENILHYITPEGGIKMQNTPSQKRSPKGVGHVCSNCGQMVECDLNTDLYEALKRIIGVGLSHYNQDDLDGANKAIAKAEGNNDTD